jgi:hypothetical protein
MASSSVYRILLLVTLGSLTGTAFALPTITLDGSDLDWQGLPSPTTHYSQDTLGDGQGYGWDIDKFWCFPGYSAALSMNAWNYMSQQADPWPNPTSGTDRLFVLINADEDINSGNPNQFGYAGVDYYIYGIPNAPVAYLCRWDLVGSTWSTTVIGATPTARGTGVGGYWIQEFSVDPSLIAMAGDLHPEITWCAGYLDGNYNAANPQGDRAPNITTNKEDSWRKCSLNGEEPPGPDPNPIPEPGTSLLFGLGMLGLAAVRRRRTA